MTRTRTNSPILGAYLDVKPLEQGADDRTLFGELVESAGIEGKSLQTQSMDESVDKADMDFASSEPDVSKVVVSTPNDNLDASDHKADVTLVPAPESIGPQIGTVQVNPLISVGDSIEPKVEIESFMLTGGDDGEDDPIGTPGSYADTPTVINGDESDNTLEGSGYDNWIFGNGGNDTIYGGGGLNVLQGGDGNDDIFGGDATDHIHGGDGDDDLFGGDGIDYIYGGDNHDNLYGGLGNDSLMGDAGNDNLFGDEGDDLLYDNPGNDTYTGGDGADTFTFAAIGWFWVGGSGEDIIEDFELGVDKLKIGNLDPSYSQLSFADYIDQHAFGQADPGVVIEWENGLIRLPGISVADLNPWDIELM